MSSRLKLEKLNYLKKFISNASLYFEINEISKGKVLMFCLQELKSNKEEEIYSFLKAFYPKAILFIEDNVSLSLKNKVQIDRRNGGVYCPTCDQLAKEYKRNISSNSTKFLISLVREFENRNDWVHYKECKFSSRDYPALAYWGLAETKIDPDRNTRTNGMWRPTQEGIDFVKGRIKVAKYVYTFNGKVTGFCEDKMVNISECLGQHFNYDSMMKNMGQS